MSVSIRLFLSFCLAASIFGHASPSDPLPQPDVALTNARVVDVIAGEALPATTVLLKEGRIAALGGEVPEGAMVVDLKGRYLAPGLIDAHTHLNSLSSARRALESGVTTVRSASVGSYQDVVLKNLVRKGYLAGPDVLAAGVFVTPQLGDAILADTRLAELSGGVQTEEELRLLVRINILNGVDVIKTRTTERAGLPDTDPRKQVYTEQQIRAVVAEAERSGIPVEVHAHGDEGARAAIMAGARSIEHGTYLSTESLLLMKERGTYLVPTYSTVVDLAEPGGDYDNPVLLVRAGHMLPRLAKTVQEAYRLGVPIVTGADTGYGPNSVTRVSQEVVNLVRLGLSPADALRSATVTAAELLKIGNQTGVITEGFEADLIAVEENPLENPESLQDVLLVVSNGRIALNRLDFALKE